MATVSLHNVRKIYPYATLMERRKQRDAKGLAPKRTNLQITDEGVVAVQAFKPSRGGEEKRQSLREEWTDHTASRAQLLSSSHTVTSNSL